MSDLKSHIREVPDFPKPGISFKDITPLLADAKVFEEVTRQLAEPFRGKVDGVVGIESRGFIFGCRERKRPCGSPACRSHIPDHR